MNGSEACILTRLPGQKTLSLLPKHLKIPWHPVLAVDGRPHNFDNARLASAAITNLRGNSSDISVRPILTAALVFLEFPVRKREIVY